MDFVEQLLGISPDGGTGSFEFLLFAIPICGVVYLYLKRRVEKRRMPWSCAVFQQPAGPLDR
jgi:hypothetical protein